MTANRWFSFDGGVPNLRWNQRSVSNRNSPVFRLNRSVFGVYKSERSMQDNRKGIHRTKNL